MRRDVEGDLTRALRAAFDTTPRLAPDFPEAVRRRRRQRRRRRAGVFGVFGALLAFTAAGVATVQPAGDTVADSGQAPDVRTMWPEAIVTLPPLLPGKQTYTVDAALGAGLYLAQPTDGATVLLDANTGRTRRLGGDFPRPQANGYEITERHIVWSAPAGDGLNVYAQARDGSGEAFDLGHLPDTDVSVTETGGVFHAVASTKHGNNWSLRMYRLAAGAEPVPVPGGDGHVLVDGPWAVRGLPQPGAANRLPLTWGPNPSLARVLTEPRTAPAYWNVNTGQRVTPAVRAPILSCTAAACIGHDDGVLVSWNADGTHEIRAAGVPLDPRDRADVFFSSTGRFAQVATRTPRESTATVTGNHVWDRATGELATVRGQMSYDVIDLGTEGGRVVLDLTRVVS
ncbi:hypothetical protein [Actinoplanes sp. G11-F43]|uniref:hypothetical protein n=1 Tax=Actinoplanes sp. G11-F43 TaxID=3424130 RepID=UPI003D34CA79